LSDLGLLADLAALEDTGRLRLHVTAGHSDAEIARAASCVAAALDLARADTSAPSHRPRLRAAA
jgi:glycine C-acetyltransferase